MTLNPLTQGIPAPYKYWLGPLKHKHLQVILITDKKIAFALIIQPLKLVSTYLLMQFYAMQVSNI